MVLTFEEAVYLIPRVFFSFIDISYQWNHIRKDNLSFNFLE